MIGFGPTVWSRKRGETEYGFKAHPAGRLRLDDRHVPAGQGRRRRRRPTSSTGMFQQLANDARKASAEQLQPGDENRMFYKLPVWKRVIIMLGGPFMNLVIGTVLIGIVLVPASAPLQSTTTVSEVYKCVVPASQAAPGPGRRTASPATRKPRPRPPASGPATSSPPLTAAAGHRLARQLTALIRPRRGQQTPITCCATAMNIRPPSPRSLPNARWTTRPTAGANGHGEPATVQAGFVGMGAVTRLGAAAGHRGAPGGGGEPAGDHRRGAASSAARWPMWPRPPSAMLRAIPTAR